MRYLVLLALSLTACPRLQGPDCEAYAEHAADLDDPAPGMRDANVEAERSACESGRIPEEKVECVNRASTREQLLQCYGLGAGSEPPSPPVQAEAEPEPPPPPGSTRVALVEVRKAGEFQPIAPAESRPADQVEWIEQLRKEIAACETQEVHAPRQVAMLVTFSSESPTFFVQDVPDELASCLKSAFFMYPQPASVGNGPADFIIDLGK